MSTPVGAVLLHGLSRALALRYLGEFLDSVVRYPKSGCFPIVFLFRIDNDDDVGFRKNLPTSMHHVESFLSSFFRRSPDWNRQDRVN